MNQPSTPAASPSVDSRLRDMRRALDGVSSRDFGRLLGRWRSLSRRPDESRLASLAADIGGSVARRRARVAAKPAITLDESLPISARTEDIVELIRQHQVVVIAGETGSGKTTQLPKLCLAAGRGEAGMIGCTQPRRLAARSVARRVAEELNTPLGEIVGFQVRFNDQVSERSLIKFMTDGILLAETQGDPWLSAYDTIIIDEAHERSLNIDFLLGYLKRLAKKRPELKIIVTSATIDTARFAEHFKGAPVVSVEGRAFPVEVRWRSLDQLGSSPDERRGTRDMQQGSAEHIAAVLDEITHDDPRGDVLVFLPGEREIRDAHLLLSRRQYRETEILPLYARLSAGDQDRVFKPGNKRRVVLATNVAETSLTVPRIRYVIDTGTARVKRYSQRSQLERLHVEPIAQAAADQRKGRCGRVSAGICYRLYDEADYASRAAFADPELLRSSLANVILRMLALQLGEVEDFPFLDAPDPRVVADGYRRLAEISAIDDARKLTGIGRTLAKIPIDVQLARMLVEGDKLQSVREVLTIVSYLSVQDPRERPADARQQADAAHALFADPKSDFVGVLNLWRAYHEVHEELTQSKLRDWCSRHFLSFMRMREWRELHRQLLLVVQELGWTRDVATVSVADAGNAHSKSPSVMASARARGNQRAAKARMAGNPASREQARVHPVPASEKSGSNVPSTDQAGRLFEAIHRSLLAGLPTQVGHKDEKGVFRSTRERKFHVFPGSALSKVPPNWIFSAQILDVGGRVWGMMNARIEPLWIEQQAAHLLRASCRDAHWSKKRGCVVAYEQVSLFGLVLVEKRPVTFQLQDPPLAHAIFLREAMVRGDIDSRADFIRANQRVLEDALGIEAKQRREGLIRHEDDLVAFFEGKLPEDIASSRALDAWYRKARPAEQAALRWSLDDVMVGGTGLDAKAFPATLDMDVRVPGAQDAQERPLEISPRRYRLEYRFTPGDEADGVTLHLPLAMLNALPTARCEWLVPGLLGEKVAELIRGLPKPLRRNFVPAPDFARAFIEAEPSRDESLAKVLAAFLKRATGVEIAAAEFGAVELPAHFSMRYRLHEGDDSKGRTLATSRDLGALRRQWEGQAREAFSRKTDMELTREDVTSWDFEEIPARVHSDGGLMAFPALVDLGETVALRVFERSDEASEAHRLGVVRLLRNALASDAKQARRRLPVGNALALKYAPLGSVDRLREDLLDGGFDDLLARHDLDVRTAGAFESLRAQCARELFAAGVERLKLAEPIIEAQAELKPWLQPPLLGFAKASYDDLHEQLDSLLRGGFLRELPLARLAHFPRYLKAMRLRAERLRQDPAKDQQRLLQVLPYWREYLKHRAGKGASSTTGVSEADLAELRWLIEEWRVSLFAQELKTAEPVSAKRLAKALEVIG